MYTKLFSLYQTKDAPAPSIAHLESRQANFNRLLIKLNSLEEEGCQLLPFDFDSIALESKEVIPFFQQLCTFEAELIFEKKEANKTKSSQKQEITKELFKSIIRDKPPEFHSVENLADWLKFF